MTSIEHYPQQESIIASDVDEGLDDDDMQAFIARMEAAYASLKAKQDTLLDLYKNGNQDELNSQIDEISDGIVSHNPEFQQNLAKIKELRTYRNPDNEAIGVIISDQKRIFETIRGMVIHEAGLPDDAQLSSIEAASKTIASKLHETYKDTSYSSRDALITLGIITVDEENSKDILHFPSEIVPEGTTELWETYLASVCVHIKAADDLANKRGGDQRTVEEADRTRTYAHNAITREFNAILSLQTTDPWDYTETRKLLAGMRDQVFPTPASALSRDNATLIDRRLTNLEISSQLSAH